MTLVHLLYVLAGISAYAGLSHLLFGVRSFRNLVHFLFSAMCFVASAFALLQANLFQAETSETWVMINRYALSMALLYILLSLRFVMEYAKLYAAMPWAIFTVIHGALLIANLTQPYTAQFESLPLLEQQTLSWGEVITNVEGQVSIFMKLILLVVWTQFIYMSYLLVQYYKTGHRQAALLMIAGLSFLFFTTFQGTLARLGLIHSVPMGAFGVMGSLIAMNIAMRYESMLREEKMFAILDHIPAAIYLKDRQGRYLLVNRYFAERLAVPITSMIGKTVNEFLPPSLAQPFLQNDETIWREQAIVESEEQALLNGELRDIHTIKFPLLNSDHQPYAICGISTDITAKKKIELELIEKERRLHSLIEQSPIAISMSKDGCLIDVNYAYLKMFGLESKASILGQPAIERIAPAQRASVADRAKRRNEGLPTEVNYETIGLRQDGTEFPILVTAYRLDLKDGAVSTTFFMDISDQKKAEAELRLHRDSLQEQIAAQTQALREAKAQAESANQAKSEFLASMSHEIRTPMNSIIGMSYLALQLEPPAKLKDYLLKIQLSAKNLLGIINDILDLSKIEAGKIQLERQPFLMTDLFDNLSKQLAGSANDKGLDIHFEIDDALSYKLLGDSLRLSQVLINYLSNAIKFTERGEITVSAKILAEDEHASLIRCEVRDTGVGISETQLSQLFQNFQQADVSITRKYGGTGLGLAICKRLIEMMGGVVGAESQLGKGSVFWFELRLEKSDQFAVVELQSPQQSGSLYGRRFLVVEDNMFNQEVAKGLLEMWGGIVSIAENGEQAISMMLQQQFDCVLMDMQMRVMDGLTATRRIRAMPALSQSLIIAMSANARRDDWLRCQEAGMDDFIGKPFLPEELQATLVQAIERHRQGASTLEDEEADMKGSSILLVEDSTFNQAVISGLLENSQVRVDIANNGKEALQLCEKTRYDLVLMDLRMPVMDGVTTCSELRQNPENQSLPIIAMSADLTPEVKAQCLAAGMNDYLSKPVAPEEFSQKLKKWLRTGVAPAPLNVNHTENPSDLLTQLSQIPDFDAKKGLKLMNGQSKLYLKVVGYYLRNQKELLAELQNALSMSDWERVSRIIHTSKGMNGNVGACALQNMAKDIEQLLAEKAALDVVKKHLTDFHDAAMILLTKIEAILPVDSSPTEMNLQKDTVQTDVVVSQLIGLLEGYNGKTTTFLEENADLLRFALGAEKFFKVEHAVQQYNFEDALWVIKQS